MGQVRNIDKLLSEIPEEIWVLGENVHGEADLIGHPLPRSVVSSPQFKVLNSIIESDSVDMVNVFGRQKGPAEVRFHDKAVLGNLLSVPPEGSISVHVYATGPVSVLDSMGRSGFPMPHHSIPVHVAQILSNHGPCASFNRAGFSKWLATRADICLSRIAASKIPTVMRIAQTSLSPLWSSTSRNAARAVCWLCHGRRVVKGPVPIKPVDVGAAVSPGLHGASAIWNLARRSAWRAILPVCNDWLKGFAAAAARLGHGRAIHVRIQVSICALIRARSHLVNINNQTAAWQGV